MRNVNDKEKKLFETEWKRLIKRHWIYHCIQTNSHALYINGAVISIISILKSATNQ
jgi:hypothetical protein